MSNIYDRRRLWKIIFIAVSLIVAAFFLVVSNNLVNDLSEQERARMEIWANATKEIAMAGMGSDSTTLVNTDIDFLLSIIEENRNIPVLLVDDSDNIILHRNFRLPEPVDETMPYYISPANEEFLKHKLSSMKGSRNCIELNIDRNTVQRLYYEDSDLLVRLSIFPYIQLVVMLVFIAIVYFAVV